ncbi:hypothetical protein [Commensalibacter sp. A3DC]|uniref:hypothetical protein n=1 Tax=Commensalibacter sp. A3DC TaxID=3093920 RepID=UPI0039B37403
MPLKFDAFTVPSSRRMIELVTLSPVLLWMVIFLPSFMSWVANMLMALFPSNCQIADGRFRIPSVYFNSPGLMIKLCPSTDNVPTNFTSLSTFCSVADFSFRK